MPDLIALWMPPGPAFVDELRRAWDLGHAVLPLDVRLPRAAVDRLVDELLPARVLDSSGWPTSVPGGGRPVEPGDAVVVATSGTTGSSKGVVLTHSALAASSAATSARLGIDPARHHWLCCLPVAHVGGLAVITRALWAGTGLTVLAGFDPSAVSLAAASGARDGATHVSLVVTALQQIDASMFEHIVLGGSAVPPDSPANVTPTYGLTETGSGCIYGGEPLAGVEVRVGSEDGELHLRGPMLLRAYRGRKADIDPFLPDGWFATGDLGGWDPVARRVTVQGRRGDLIITGGEKVWPDPVERVLSRVAGVAAVAVVGRPDPKWGRAVTAVVVPADPASPPKLEALREAVKAELAPYCAPQRLELAESLPRTALGKVQRNRL